MLGDRLGPRGRRRFAIGLGGLILAVKLSDFALGVAVWGHDWRDELPLHLCPAASYLSALVLLRPRQRVWEIAYFWSVAGGANALLLPNLDNGYPSASYLFYFLGHGLPIPAVLFLATAYGYRATLGSVARALRAMFAFAVVVAPINVLLDTNYLFLRKEPEVFSALEWVGPWPYYLLALVAMATISSLIAYSPFATVCALSALPSTAIAQRHVQMPGLRWTSPTSQIRPRRPRSRGRQNDWRAGDISSRGWRFV